jgi:hypothetical protein
MRLRLMAPSTKPDGDPRVLSQVLGTLMFDSTPPEGVRFEGFPRAMAKGQRLSLKVRAVDRESGIAKVNFFLGELKDGKLPEALPPGIKATPGRDGDEVWSAEVPVPDKAGEISIIAQVINGVGLVALADTKIELTDPPAPTGKLKGKVVEGGRPQPNLAVTIKAKGNKPMPVDPKNPLAKEQDTWTATTNDKGEFTVDDLPPGNYEVSATSKSVASRKARKTVEVKAKATAEIELSLTP